MSQENTEQGRIRQIIYLNLDRLFKELSELESELSGGYQGKKKEKKEIIPDQE